MKKFIEISKNDREFIMQAFGCSERMVFKAIRYEDGSATDLAKRIRKLALERGGIEMAVVPLTETLFDADGYMRQYFANGAMMELDIRHNRADVFDKDCNRYCIQEDVRLCDIPAIQKVAESL
ncbi:hypothetical protein [Prevotella sp. P3-122]|uniref:hypothetical protein n=1 Tax=Prevotella sp. P3-122 TaxID=2024223 RepID=UPI000B97ABFF|nr:hypothetical protein [Prevotella sp. P3-122]OYP58478.1 hypothetical protein CIL02_13865 [Prevotella sp. P3-122]